MLNAVTLTRLAENDNTGPIHRVFQHQVIGNISWRLAVLLKSDTVAWDKSSQFHSVVRRGNDRAIEDWLNHVLGYEPFKTADVKNKASYCLVAVHRGRNVDKIQFVDDKSELFIVLMEVRSVQFNWVFFDDMLIEDEGKTLKFNGKSPRPTLDFFAKPVFVALNNGDIKLLNSRDHASKILMYMKNATEED